jgi:hypothetical protein
MAGENRRIQESPRDDSGQLISDGRPSPGLEARIARGLEPKRPLTKF